MLSIQIHINPHSAFCSPNKAIQTHLQRRWWTRFPNKKLSNTIWNKWKIFSKPSQWMTHSLIESRNVCASGDNMQKCLFFRRTNLPPHDKTNTPKLVAGFPSSITTAHAGFAHSNLRECWSLVFSLVRCTAADADAVQLEMAKCQLKQFLNWLVNRQAGASMHGRAAHRDRLECGDRYRVCR